MKELRSVKPGWYVVQVSTGRERRMCALIERACAEYDKVTKPDASVGLEECFSPRFRTQRKWKGEWTYVERPLLPGYVIADAHNPVALASALRGVHDFCRVLSTEETYEPLVDYERTWIESYTKKGDRVVPMSFGRRVGDAITVERGPLQGQEGKILKVDRAHSMAHLEFHVGQMTIKTKVGLGIVPEDAQEKRN